MNATRTVNRLFIILILSVLAAAVPGCNSSPGDSSSGQSSAETGADQAREGTPPEDRPGESGKQQTQGSSGERPWFASPEASPQGSSHTAPPAAPVRQPRQVMLDEGTPLVIRTASRISTKTNQPGQLFYATLEEALVSDDWVIAKKGAEIEGIVTECDPGGRVKGVARLAVQLRKLTLADGRTVEIQTSTIRRQARATKKKDAQKIGIGAGVGTIVGAIAGGGKGAAIGAAVGGGAGTGVVLATHGDPATIASETRLAFKLSEPVKIVEEI